MKPSQTGRVLILTVSFISLAALTYVSVQTGDLKYTTVFHTPTRIPVSQEALDPTSNKELWRDALKRHFVLPKDLAWGGHAVLLFSAIYATKGPILELGSGYFSTPVIHNVSVVEQSRDAYTVDLNVRWLARFAYLGSSHHRFGYVSERPQPQAFGNITFQPVHFNTWDDIWHREFGLVFVDHSPGERRRVDIQIFRNLTDVMLVHDTDNLEGYGYEPLLSSFAYRYRFKRRPRFKSFTDVVSMTRGDLVQKIEKLTNWSCDLLHV